MTNFYNTSKLDLYKSDEILNNSLHNLKANLTTIYTTILTRQILQHLTQLSNLSTLNQKNLNLEFISLNNFTKNFFFKTLSKKKFYA